MPLAGGLRKAGDPIHDMLLRLVVDEQLNIVEAGSETRWMPYPGHCDDHGDAYRALAGLNLLEGFRAAVRERLGGSLGCTHLTELTQVLPTAVIQAFAGEVIDTREDGEHKPFQLDRCHALRTDGAAVKPFYPRWYRGAQDPAAASSPTRASETPMKIHEYQGKEILRQFSACRCRAATGLQRARSHRKRRRSWAARSGW